jgi:hypothetical protein
LGDLVGLALGAGGGGVGGEVAGGGDEGVDSGGGAAQAGELARGERLFEED